MIKYDITKIQELFDRHSITDFSVKDVYENENGILIYVKRRVTIASYLQSNSVLYLKFKNGAVIYEVNRFFVNMGEHVKMVFVIKKGDEVLDVLSLYEINNHEKFSNRCVGLVIDEIIKEI